jgi:hypothetical protein
MAIIIKSISEERFTVNGKLVYQDMSGKWHGKFLTQTETAQAEKHIATLEKQA